jgi:hypothetical protein
MCIARALGGTHFGILYLILSYSLVLHCRMLTKLVPINPLSDYAYLWLIDFR